MLRGLRCLLGRVLRHGCWCLLARLRGGRRVLVGLLSVPLGACCCGACCGWYACCGACWGA